MKMILIPAFVLFLAAQASAAPPAPKNARFETLAPAGGLEAALRQARSGASAPVWVGYEVPMVAGMGRVCCFSRNHEDSTCLLEGKNNGWSSNRDKPLGEQALQVLVRFEGDKVTEIRGLSADCQLDAGGRRFVWLGAVKPEESVAYLAGLARTGREGHGGWADESISTLALHRNPAADTVLEELASSRYPSKKREQALFWMGQTRGERGARFLEGVLRNDKDDDIREKAIFSLSQSDVSWAASAIIRTAKEDRSPKIRGEALFWLAQMKTAEAPGVILAAIEKDPDPEVRKKAIFALSQLHGSQGVNALLKVAKESRDPEVRREAFFWLGQSKDPAALAYLDKVLND
jgi:HEAT repeat protein